MTIESRRNNLKDEQSLYLKQHSNDPIFWNSYGPEVIIMAQEQNKPIFLSIGYATCHWCHVMHEESFIDQEIATFLNDNFVCIKVDKEEYPDLDHYYQVACQLYSKSGGWPLSVFAFPDLKPFYVGTYFPKNNYSHPQIPTFKDVLYEVVKIFKDSPDTAKENANQVDQMIKEGLFPKDKVEFQGHFPHPMSILEAIKPHIDEENGGYGKSPKFPNYPFYEWSIEQMIDGMIGKDEGNHIIKSIENMLFGAIYDKGRGGIHRYAVDEKWAIPHFEKMLYDQAGLLRLLAKTSLLYPSPLIFDALYNTLEYLKVEMLSDNNYFFAAQDADSEGIEGLYFTYTEPEFEDLINSTDQELSEDQITNIKKWFGISLEGNFPPNLNTIKLDPSFKDDLYRPENWQIVRKIRDAIITDRKNRIPPLTDNTGIASWNFMIITALCDVIQYCKVDAIKQSALNILNQVALPIIKTFIIQGDKEGQVVIRHNTTNGSKISYLEDYATYAESQFKLYQIFGNKIYKDNFIDSLNFIEKEFIHNNNFVMRALSQNENEIYPNMSVDGFDNALRSSASLMINLMQKGALLSNQELFVDNRIKIAEVLIHQCLKNPINSGEGLRALCYPQEAYKLVKVPYKWLQDSSFREFMSYFMHRFVFEYNENNDSESFEICSSNQCELKGIGLKEFIKVLTP